MKLKNRNIIVFDYLVYNYILNLLWMILDVFPYVIRNIFFKFIFRKHGISRLIDYKSFIHHPWRGAIGGRGEINRGCKSYKSMQTSYCIVTLNDYAVLCPKAIFCAADLYCRVLELPYISKAVTICRYAWVGGNSMILPRVTTGGGTVIGARSVVAKEISACTKAVVNSAKNISNLTVLVKSDSYKEAGGF